MPGLIFFALAGLAGQLVDGSLGMAFGVTATTVLLTVGTAPAVASASVHLAEIGTSLVSGVSHWRFGNVDWGVVARMAVPGAIGAFAGATVLSNLSTEAAEPWMSGLLLALGLYIVIRFAGWRIPVRSGKPTSKFLAPLGLVAGFVDATGGGGWGPVATPTLIGSGKLDPRKTVGSVVTAEFIVTIAASAGFLIGLSDKAISGTAVLGLLIGGVIVAPLAAYLVRILPAYIVGTSVGGIVVLTNAGTLLKAFEVGGHGRLAWYLVLGVLWIVGIVVAVRRHRRRSEQHEVAEPVAGG